MSLFFFYYMMYFYFLGIFFDQQTKFPLNWSHQEFLQLEQSHTSLEVLISCVRLSDPGISSSCLVSHVIPDH